MLYYLACSGGDSVALKVGAVLVGGPAAVDVDCACAEFELGL